MITEFLTPRRTNRSSLDRWTIASFFAGILAAGSVPALGAQGSIPPRGAGPDARTPPAGSLRVGIGATWARNAESYDETGNVRELGARFTLDPLGASALPQLGLVESRTQLLAALPNFTASLGRAVTHNRKSVETTPFTFEYGVTERLAVGVVVPLVTSISRVDFAINPAGANLGFNPSLLSSVAAEANRQLLTEFDGAAAFLNGRIATCTANPQAAGCEPITANIESARTLVTQSSAFANTLGLLYGGRTGSTGAAFIPLVGSSAQAAIDARIAGFKAQYAALGASQIVSAAPIGAGAPLTASDFQRVLTDSAYGIIANPLGSVVRRGIGDIDLSAMWTWHDTWSDTPRVGSLAQRLWWRSAIIGTFRLGTGSAADPADLIPVPLGDGQNDIEVQSVTDIGIGARYSLTGVLRYTRQHAAAYPMRFQEPVPAFPAVPSHTTTPRDLGDEFAVALYPRVNLSEAVSLAASYTYRQKGDDAFPELAWGEAGAAKPPWFENTAERAHALGASLAYSTLAAHSRGNARWPLEISIDHFQTTRGSGGAAPKLAYDAVTVRYYWRLRPAAPARGPD